MEELKVIPPPPSLYKILMMKVGKTLGGNCELTGEKLEK